MRECVLLFMLIVCREYINIEQYEEIQPRETTSQSSAHQKHNIVIMYDTWERQIWLLTLYKVLGKVFNGDDDDAKMPTLCKEWET